jgi:hypothetical protein
MASIVKLVFQTACSAFRDRIQVTATEAPCTAASALGMRRKAATVHHLFKVSIVDYVKFGRAMRDAFSEVMGPDIFTADVRQAFEDKYELLTEVCLEDAISAGKCPFATHTKQVSTVAASDTNSNGDTSSRTTARQRRSTASSRCESKQTASRTSISASTKRLRVPQLPAAGGGAAGSSAAKRLTQPSPQLIELSKSMRASVQHIKSKDFDDDDHNGDDDAPPPPQALTKTKSAPPPAI